MYPFDQLKFKSDYTAIIWPIINQNTFNYLLLSLLPKQKKSCSLDLLIIIKVTLSSLKFRHEWLFCHSFISSWTQVFPVWLSVIYGFSSFIRPPSHPGVHLPRGWDWPAMALFKHFNWSQCAKIDAVSQRFRPTSALQLSGQCSRDQLCLTDWQNWSLRTSGCSL